MIGRGAHDLHGLALRLDAVDGVERARPRTRSRCAATCVMSMTSTLLAGGVLGEPRHRRGPTAPPSRRSRRRRSPALAAASASSACSRRRGAAAPPPEAGGGSHDGGDCSKAMAYSMARSSNGSCLRSNCRNSSESSHAPSPASRPRWTEDVERGTQLLGRCERDLHASLARACASASASSRAPASSKPATATRSSRAGRRLVERACARRRSAAPSPR